MTEQDQDFWRQLRQIRDRNAKRGATADVAYWTIRDAIRGDLIQQGDRLIELDLAGALEMSRTPVREALRRLAVERLVEKAPSRGFVVPTIGIEDLVEIYELREVLEGLAARRAAHRFGPTEIAVLAEAVERSERARDAGDMHVLWEGSNHFHRILRGSDHSRVTQLLTLLLDAHRSLRLHEFGPERITDAVAEHRAIYEAIAARNPEEAERLARDHSRNALRSQLRARHLADG
jgi:DNA-binding GntR family transcriptional regulator